MLNKLLITCLVIFLCTNASAQKSAEDYIKELKAAGYSEIQPLSFAITKTNYALTGLFKGKADKTRLMFSAEISSDKDGANLFFRAYRKCTLSNKDARRLDEKIIVVHGQKIEAYYFCGAGQDGQTNEIYKIKSVAGSDFIKVAFTENNYVFVNMNGLPVPFHTEGFSKALAESSGKAL